MRASSLTVPSPGAVPWLGLCVLALWGRAAAGAQDSPRDAASDWRSEWAVAEGFGLHLDTEGYHLPTAIAFVPQPGTGPKDPLYFVTELRGSVKVVTNDRSVYTFADDILRTRPEEELPAFAGETGLAGICLAPAQGYVFVTFAYQEAASPVADSAPRSQPHMASNRATKVRRAGRALRNNIVRFETKPQTFSLEPTGQLSFTELFAGYEASISHQIGPCQVTGDLMYVSVADGYQTAQSQQINSVLGKVLRMTLDGEPAPGNPFLLPDDGQVAADYVWAYGFRNPFSLKTVGSRVFAADNGVGLDRFLELEAGENYLWDGSDWSIGARADLTFSPDVGPAQVEYYPGGQPHLPGEYAHSFFVATSNPDRAGVLRIPYSLERRRVLGVPDYLLRYRGSGTQLVTGVALGPDGLYFVPTMPDAVGRSGVFKVRYDPEQPHPFLLTHTLQPTALMEEKGCFGCHQLNGSGGTVGPALDHGSLVSRSRARLNSEEYARSVAEVDRLNDEPYTRFADARAEVLRAEGREKIRTWTIYRLMEPKFDNPNAQMPNLGLSKAEATLIADHLLREKPAAERWKEAVLEAVPAALRPGELLYRHLLLAFIGGLLVGAALVPLLRRSRWRKRRPE